jgi:hypothetical protein
MQVMRIEGITNNELPRGQCTLAFPILAASFEILASIGVIRVDRG